MKVIGITGGIGAGKSTVVDYIMCNYNAYAIVIDLVRYSVMMPGGRAYNKILDTYGTDILANKFNEKSKEKLVVLGTITEEAMDTESNSIEKNTITHAIIPTLKGKPAKRWFDLPDTVLNMIEEQIIANFVPYCLRPERIAPLKSNSSQKAGVTQQDISESYACENKLQLFVLFFLISRPDRATKIQAKQQR